jgi:uncharacterized protein YhbP (UPF0306 family)
MATIKGKQLKAKLRKATIEQLKRNRQKYMDRVVGISPNDNPFWKLRL